MKKIGRNDLCPCGSGKKHKLCCLPLEVNRVSNPPVDSATISSGFRFETLLTANEQKSALEALAQLDMLYDLRFEDAQKFAFAGKKEEAMATYLAIGISQSERHYQNALVCEQRNDIPSTTALLKNSVSANPQNFNAWKKLASLLNGKEAEQACRSALNITEDIPTRIRLAELLVARNQLHDAAKILGDAMPLNRNHFELCLALANVYWKQGDFSAAEPCYRNCIRINPADARPYQTLLEILNRLDRLADAEQLCLSYLQTNTPDHMTKATLALILVRQQRWGEAETLILEILAEVPTWVQLRQIYANMLEKNGRAEEALALHKDNVAIAPDNLESHLQLADILHKSGNKAEALDSLRQAGLLYSQNANWGLNMLPGSISQRLIFHHLENIAEHYCTGQRSLIDNTGLDMTPNAYPLGKVVELFCMVVGLEHIEFLEHVSFPALFATEGFDELLRERKVIYNIYTTHSDLQHLQGFLDKLTQRGVPYRINVELLSFSQDLYPILCLPIIDQVKRALSLQSVVVMALPDAIISGSVARVIKDMQPDMTVVCAMPRIDSLIAYPALKEDLREGKSLNSRDYVRRCMTEFLHPQTYAALKNDSNCIQYRDTGSYYSAHNFAPPPLCFYARPEMLDHMLLHPLCGPNSLASFYAIDHDFVESAFRTKNLFLIPDSDYFFWAEFTHPQRHTDFLAGRKAEDYYYPDASGFVYQHEFKWIYQD